MALKRATSNGKDGLTEEPAFTYDVGRKWMLLIPITLLFFTVAVKLVFSPPESLIASIFFLVALGLVPNLIRYSKPNLRKALFYDDRVELWERSTRRTVKYAQIMKVEPLKPTLTGPRIALYIIDEKGPIGMIANPKSKVLDTDLLSWTKTKVRPFSNGANRNEY